MAFRDPLLGLERQLEAREAELERLEAKRTPRRRKSRKLKALERRLAEAEQRLAKTGRRELTPREAAHIRWLTTIGRVLLVLAPAVLGVHVAMVVRSPLAWRETTCTIRIEEEEGRVARYRVDGEDHSFGPSASAPTSGTVPCWVPSPSRDGIGTLERPSGARVSLWRRLSPWGVGVPVALVFFAAIVVFGARAEARNRRANRIVADDFSTND
jgi:hypothetical protein